MDTYSFREFLDSLKDFGFLQMERAAIVARSWTGSRSHESTRNSNEIELLI